MIRYFAIVIFLIYLNAYTTKVLASQKLTCYDCSGCDDSPYGGATGRCSTGSSEGKCFIRKDPNGIVYRGCADDKSWPGLDTTYSGCRYQKYGWWSDREVLWCFCDSDLCNTDTEDLMKGEEKVGGVYLKGREGVGGVYSKGRWDQAEGGSDAFVILSDKVKPSVSRRVAKSLDNEDWNLGSGKFVTWEEAQSDLYGPDYQYEFSIPVLTDKRRLKGKKGFPGLPPVIPPLLPPVYIYPPIRKLTVSPPEIIYTTPPDLGQTTSTPPPDSNTTTFTTPTTTPTTPSVTQTGPIFNIPADLLEFLLKNLPKNKNDVHTVSNPVYILLYLLSSSGVNLNDYPGFNISGINITGTIPDIPSGNYSLGCMMAGCEQYCVFLLGQPQCRCRPGFTLNNDIKTCSDVNECDSNNGGCDQLCYNTVGSFYCDCQPFYQLSDDQTTCQDINECMYNNGGCSNTCRNLPGSYICSCPQGYELGLDNRTCISISGQCTQDQERACSQRCTSEGGVATCSCYQGYVLNSDSSTCTDIDECADMSDGCNQTCTNTPGSFICGCRTGYQLATNRRDCIDNNECLDSNGGCRQTCVNIAGSYYCDCETGFTVGADGKSCIDVDECSVNNGGCSQNCTNIPGSFICSCYSDYFQLQPDRLTCIGACPSDYIKNDALGSCYKIFTSIQQRDARVVNDAQTYCRQTHQVANLVSVETIQEKNYLAQLLSKEPVMLEGWQGWWTSGSYRTGLNQFYWRTGRVIPNTGDFWGFQRPPFRDTCVWILQIPNYNYTLGNYDCFTASGFICEITYSDLYNDP